MSIARRSAVREHFLQRQSLDLFVSSYTYLPMRFFLLLITGCLFGGSVLGQGRQQDSTLAVQLAQAQLDAYNQRDIDKFLEPYADTVAIYRFPGQLLYRGKEQMRKEYAGMFQQSPALHCTLVKRIALGNTVIDEESVLIRPGAPLIRAVAIYTIAGGKIATVTFIQ